MILKNLLIGIVFGYCVSRIGFYDFNEVHKMFRFQDMRMFFSFAFGVFLLIIFNLIRNKGKIKNQIKFQMGMLVGSVFFGIGWAVTGACPLAVFLQIAHGHLPALVTLLGVITGIFTYRTLNKRFFGWKISSCGD